MESWLSGLKRLTANEVGVTAPKVRILYSPPNMEDVQLDEEAIAIAEKEYGSGERIDPKTRQYIDNPNGSWTLMNVTKVGIFS